MEKVITTDQGIMLEVTKEVVTTANLHELKAQKQAIEGFITNYQSSIISLQEKLAEVDAQIAKLEPEVLKVEAIKAEEIKAEAIKAKEMANMEMPEATL